jgi:hypothetical protein
MLDKEIFEHNNQVIEKWVKNIRKELPVQVTQLYLDFLLYFANNYEIQNNDIEILNSHHKDIILTCCKLYEAFQLKKYNNKETNPIPADCLLATCFWISCKFHTSLPIPGKAIAYIFNSKIKDICKAELNVLFYLRFNLLKYSYEIKCTAQKRKGEECGAKVEGGSNFCKRHNHMKKCK